MAKVIKSFRLSPEVVRAVEKAAIKEERSQSDIVDRALRRQFKIKRPPPSNGNSNGKKSFKKE